MYKNIICVIFLTVFLDIKIWMADNFMKLSWDKTVLKPKLQDFKPYCNHIKNPHVLMFTLHIKCQFLSP